MTAVAMLLTAQLAAAGPVDKVDVLTRWIDAVEQHRPARLDAAAERVHRMSRAQLERVRTDLRSVIALLRNPKQTVFYPEVLSRSSRVTPILYTQQELEALRDLADEVARRGNANRLVKRAAVLHTDIALLAPLDGAVPVWRQETTLERTTVVVEDGRLVKLVDSVDHAEMSRRLLDEVRTRQDRDPEPQKDDDVRLWYTALSAHFSGTLHVSMDHVDDAVRLFPEDGSLRFFAGGMRETAFAPGIYESLKRARGPRGSIMDLGSTDDELRLAEGLFRRALTASPGHVEARLRRGRVLFRLGRHAAAGRDASARMARMYAALAPDSKP